MAQVATDDDADAEIRNFYAAAGIVQYSDTLIEEGFDSLSNLLALDGAGLEALKSAVNMKTGHFANLRAKISKQVALGTAGAAAGAPAGAPAGAQPTNARKTMVTYVPAAPEEIAAMCSQFETKFSQNKYGNTMTTYTNSKNQAKLYYFLGKSINGTPAGQPVFICACTPDKARLAGATYQNAHTHLTDKGHFKYWRHVCFGDPPKELNTEAWLAFQAGNKTSDRHMRTSQFKRRKTIVDAKRGFAQTLNNDSPVAPPPQFPHTTAPPPAATHTVPHQEPDDDLFGEREAQGAAAAQPETEAVPTAEAVGRAEAPQVAPEAAPAEEAAAEEAAAPAEEAATTPPVAATRTPLDAMSAWAVALAPPGYVNAGNGSL